MFKPTVQALTKELDHEVNLHSEQRNASTSENTINSKQEHVLLKSTEEYKTDVYVQKNVANSAESDPCCSAQLIDESLPAESNEGDDKNILEASCITAMCGNDKSAIAEIGNATSFAMAILESRQAEKRTTSSERALILPVSYYSDDEDNSGKKSKRICQENNCKNYHTECSLICGNLKTGESERIISKVEEKKLSWPNDIHAGEVQAMAETQYQKERTIEDIQKGIPGNVMEHNSDDKDERQKQSVQNMPMDTLEINKTSTSVCDETEEEFSGEECDMYVDLEVLRQSGMGTMCSDDSCGHACANVHDGDNVHDGIANTEPSDEGLLTSTDRSTVPRREHAKSKCEISDTESKSWGGNIILTDSGFIDIYSSSPSSESSVESSSNLCQYKTISGQSVGEIVKSRDRSISNYGMAGTCSSNKGDMTNSSETRSDSSYKMASCSSKTDIIVSANVSLGTHWENYSPSSRQNKELALNATSSTKNANSSSFCLEETSLPSGSECVSPCVNMDLPNASIQYQRASENDLRSVVVSNIGQASCNDQIASAHDYTNDESTECDGNLQTHISRLHYPLLTQILSHLSVYTLLRVVPRVCRYWSLASQDRDLWVNVNLRNQLRLDDGHLIQLLSRTTGHTRHLNVSDCRLLTDVAVQHVLSTNPALVTLKLIRCYHLTDEAFNVAQNTLHTGLKNVYLDGCSRFTDTAVQRVSNLFPNLKCLHLNQCMKVTDELIKVLANNCPRLTELQLDHCLLVTDVGIAHIAKQCLSMQNMNLMSCGVTDDCGIHIAKMAALTHLDLSNLPRISPETVVYIARHCRLLQCLNVSLNMAIGDQCVEQVVGAIPRLKRLYCVCCSISDAGLEAIAKNCTCLESLDIGWCQSVTDSGIRVVSLACKRLEYFGLIRCDRITSETIDELVVEYPHINYSTFLLDSKRLFERARREGYKFDK